MVKALGKTATVVIGSTVPINISYPDDEKIGYVPVQAKVGPLLKHLKIGFKSPGLN